MITDARLQDGTAKSMRVIGKGDKERRVPLPTAFGAELGGWLEGRANGEYVLGSE